MNCRIKLFNHQAGDTIVEVLIATAILGVILAGAYATSSRSLNTERDAQEHAEALAVAQAQVESLRNAGSLDTANFSCFDSTGAPATSCNVPSNNDSLMLANCANAAYCYQVSDTQINASPATYKIQISWPALSGGTNTTQLYYRPQ